MPLKDQLTLPTVNDAIAVRPLSLPVPPGTTERRNLRTERSKTFAHAEKAPDGKEIRTCKAQIGAVCYRDDTGELRSIDTTIRDLGTHVGVEWAPYKFKLHETGIGFDFESREGGQCSVTLVGIGGEKFEDSIKPEVSENVITYRDVRPGCDIVFKCLNERVKTLRILRDDKAPRTFDWTVTSDKPELIDSTLIGTDAAGNQLELSAVTNGSVISETWTGKTKIIADPVTRIRSLSDDVSYPVEIDPTVTANIAAQGDDVTEVADASLYTSATMLYAGCNVTFGLNAGFTFGSLTIPQGATITSATLTLSRINGLGTPATSLYGQASDNASAFDSSHRPSQASKTTAKVVNPDLAAGASSRVITVTSIVQEVVNRAGWSSGNTQNLFLLNKGSPGVNNWCALASYSYGDQVNYPKASLSITYAAAAGGTAGNLLLLGCG